MKRRKSRESLVSFYSYTNPAYTIAKHHEFIAEKLERVSRGEVRRLIIEAPPRHSKTVLSSIALPSWFLGKHPDREVISVSYNIEYARDVGRLVRNTVTSPEYLNIFPQFQIAEDSRSVGRWHTVHGGGYTATGIGGSLTGRGAHLIIIDDPIKNQQDADSKLVREKVFQFYKSVLYTRLAPGGSIVIVNTRWHSLDLTGQLLDEALNDPNADQWERVSLPAIAERDDQLHRKPGEALWPERFNVETLEQIRIALSAQEGPRAWLCLYQQKPIEEQGVYFRRDWFKFYNYTEIKDKITQQELSHRASSYFHIYCASDYAVDTASTGDYTVHIVAGVDPHGDLYILDLWRERADADQWVEAAIDLMDRYQPMCWAEENGQINRSVGPFLQRRMRERNVFCRREQFASTTDKVARIRSIQARLSSGRVYLPKGSSWANDLVAELCHFPGGGHDDMVDAMSLLGRMLDQMTVGREAKADVTGKMSPTTYGEYTKALRRFRRTGRMDGIVV